MGTRRFLEPSQSSFSVAEESGALGKKQCTSGRAGADFWQGSEFSRSATALRCGRIAPASGEIFCSRK